ncbi:exocyst complex component 4-like isoform X2 [Montipora capricornis]|uniref:exocyst complex component 4-like isoform X2 n=1 Tax=Montipora foliosa TaxID=591990 RepID=UPI0035F18A2C
MAAFEMAFKGRRQKESSSSKVLLSVITTLLSSDNVERRKIEKERLQYELRECDDKLNRQVEAHQDHLKSSIQTFTGISTRIAASLDKVKTLRENLQACKSLLHCKREELKKYWMDGLEYNEVLNLLDRIDQVKNVPEQIEKYKKKKYYLHATELLVSTVSILEGSLSGVEALRHLRLDLQTRKKVEHEILIKNLNTHVYLKSEKSRQKRTKLAQYMSDDSSSRELSSSVGSGGIFKKSHTRSASRSLMLEQTSSVDTSFSTEITEDLNVDPEADSDHFMILIIESLSLLGKIPEALEAVKKRMKIEMSLIIHRATTLVAKKAGQPAEILLQQNQTHHLMELLDVVFDLFRGVAHAHETVLSAIHRVIKSSDFPTDLEDADLYTIDVVWSEIQFAIQVLLGDYLDVQNTATQQGPVTFNDSSSDVAAFFSLRRRGPIKSDERTALYRFEGSSSAISMNTYIRERRQECIAGTANEDDDDTYGEPLHTIKPQLLCKPNPRNITVVFIPLMSFVREIEAAIKVQGEMRCTLYGFITDYVKDIFVEEIFFDIREKLREVTQDRETFRRTTDSGILKFLGANRPLLQSTATVAQLLQDLKNLMHSIPNYSPQFLEMVCSMLTIFKMSCYDAYKTLLQYSGEADKSTRVFSANWTKDEDISRCLRSLPNWPGSHHHHSHRQRKEEEEQDVEAVRKRNQKETDILTDNLAQHLLNDLEVLFDTRDLRTLANLQESMEWLACHIRLFTTSLNAQSTTISLVKGDSQERIKAQEIPPVSQEIIQSLTSLSEDFQNISESCLLVLHLEIRFHCFYYLMRAVQESSYICNSNAMDPDPNVNNLNKSLSSFEEIATACMGHYKFRYLFEGVGFLVSSILVSNVSEIKRINPNGIKKMCRNIFAIQQNLTNITMSREGDLDRARQYYELLYSNPDEILTSIVEQGAKFNQKEYADLLSLQSRSQTIRDNSAHERRLQKLKDIFKK